MKPRLVHSLAKKQSPRPTAFNQAVTDRLKVRVERHVSGSNEPREIILVACSKCEWKAAFQRDLQWNVGIHRCAYRRKPAAYVAVEAKDRA